MKSNTARRITITVFLLVTMFLVSPLACKKSGSSGALGNLISMSTNGDGISHTLLVTADGSVWAFGTNSYGQLGDGTTTDRDQPVQVLDLSDVVTVAAGAFHSLALKSDGTVWAWGRNGNGQLGDNTTTDRLTPVQVSGIIPVSPAASVKEYDPTALKNITAIAAGWQHSMALTNDGYVYSWGANDEGQLGNNDNASSSHIIQAQGLTEVTAIAAGEQHSMAVRSDGNLWVWGWNNTGQLGDGTVTDSHVPQLVGGISSVTGVAAGWGHSAALRTDGTVWAWGDNSYGQLGDGTKTARYVPARVDGLSGINSIASGNKHMLALTADGTVMAWGRNYEGQCGNGSSTLWFLEPVEASGLSSVAVITAGENASGAITNGEISYVWGSSDYEGIQHSSPVEVRMP
jgi:alpha-tubulin suppressor-like RCC1 family protein